MGTVHPMVDIEQPGALVAYLRDTGRIAADARVTQLSGGVSNRALLVELDDGRAWVVKQALDKLRVAADWRADPDRIHREALALQWIADLCGSDTVPAYIFEDRERHILAMSAVPTPHRNWKEMLLAGEVGPRHVEEFGGLLGQLHRASAARIDELRDSFGDRRFFEELRLEPYYGYAAAQEPEARGFLTTLQEDTLQVATALVHGDYSPKNILVHNDRLVLLDHEVAHIGDPAFDIGFSVTHFLAKANHLTTHRDAFAMAAHTHWRAYRKALGDNGIDEARAVRHTLGCLLARVAGRSPLEYLDDAGRQRQRDTTLRLMAAPPSTVDQLIDDYVRRLA